MPELSLVSDRDLYHFGSPLLDSRTPPAFKKVQLNSTKIAGKIDLIPDHQALYLMMLCFGLVKLLHTIYTSRTYDRPDLLASFDEAMRTMLGRITSTHISGEALTQAAFPLS